MRNLWKIVLIGIPLIGIVYASQNSDPALSLQAQRSTEQKNKAIVREMTKGLFASNQRDWWQIFDKFYDRDYVMHESGTDKVITLEEHKLNYGLVRRILPSLQYVIEDIIAEGDKVAVRGTDWIKVGSKDANVYFSPSDLEQGGKILAKEISIYRIVNERIVEEWCVTDFKDTGFDIATRRK